MMIGVATTAVNPLTVKLAGDADGVVCVGKRKTRRGRHELAG
jgi:hypothetical protein